MKDFAGTPGTVTGLVLRVAQCFFAAGSIASMTTTVSFFNFTAFGARNLKTRVIGCPKTIDGDLKCREVPTSFGFDTACKIYSKMIRNVTTDACSTGIYYHCTCKAIEGT